MPVYDKHKNYGLPVYTLVEFLENQRDNHIYFSIFADQVEAKVYEEYSIHFSEEMDLDDKNALLLAAYAKVTRLTLYPGVIKHVTLEEEEEVKRQMQMTWFEVQETKKMLQDHRDRTDELLKIQQAKGLANLKYMAWETQVYEEKLLEFWFKMVDLKGEEKQKQDNIGPYRTQGLKRTNCNSHMYENPYLITRKLS